METFLFCERMAEAHLQEIYNVISIADALYPFENGLLQLFQNYDFSEILINNLLHMIFYLVQR